ncbi:hypothetical protein IEQ34_002855 [Dendrobium chrysotoxum]|uniref:Uncharacterized protein n=1 Tax=Dendrobium chrysotoxum TaxID=161865 RepID=A0AAV7HJ41_DENCH|nr:hypothetical protein IEQ34_002855 [Dendrobium chrysotoxum]
MRILKVPDIEHLLFEVCHLSRYIEEEFLFKVGLSFHAGRSDARMLKLTSKVPEPPAPTSKVAPKQSTRGEDPQVLKKKRLEGTTPNTDKALPDSSPTKFHTPEEDQKDSKEKTASLEAKDKRSQTLIAEKEAALSGSKPSKDHDQEARDHIYDIEVKALEQQCIKDRFIRGFLKGFA